MSKHSIYLASQSPRRRELLDQIGITYQVVSIDVVEEQQNGESPADYVHRLAVDKATAGAAQYADRPVLGADTIVVLNQQVLEKPASKDEAIEMLLSLSGNTHQVMTAVNLHFQSRSETLLNTTSVSFRSLSTTEAERYWSTGEPVDKAGGYGIQGIGGMFVKSIQGSYSGVVGLPLYETQLLLRQFDILVL